VVLIQYPVEVEVVPDLRDHVIAEKGGPVESPSVRVAYQRCIHAHRMSDRVRDSFPFIWVDMWTLFIVALCIGRLPVDMWTLFIVALCIGRLPVDMWNLFIVALCIGRLRFIATVLVCTIISCFTARVSWHVFRGTCFVARAVVEHCGRCDTHETAPRLMFTSLGSRTRGFHMLFGVLVSLLLECSLIKPRSSGQCRTNR